MEISPHLETFVIPGAEGVDSELARLWTVIDAMQEAAGRHAEELGVGVRDLHAKGLTWVLARFHVRAHAVPAAGAAVLIATWPTGRHRLFAVRDFLLRDGSGAEILRATSAWALMSMESRRPSRLDPHLPVFSSHPERMVQDDFDPLPPVPDSDSPARFVAVDADIDINDHVNNTVYLDWALRAVPAAARRTAPVTMEAAFLSEARLGAEVLCHGETTDADGATVIRQSLRDAGSGRELTRLRWVFRNTAT